MYTSIDKMMSNVEEKIENLTDSLLFESKNAWASAVKMNKRVITEGRRVQLTREQMNIEWQ